MFTAFHRGLTGLFHAVPTLVVGAALCGLFYWGHTTNWTAPKFSELFAAERDKDDDDEKKPPAPSPASDVAPLVVAPTPVPDTLTLIGISGTGSRRLALINDRAFGANESGKVRVGKTNVLVHCLEIRDGSVMIEVDGSQEKQELSLKVK